MALQGREKPLSDEPAQEQICSERKPVARGIDARPAGAGKIIRRDRRDAGDFLVAPGERETPASSSTEITSRLPAHSRAARHGGALRYGHLRAYGPTPGDYPGSLAPSAALCEKRAGQAGSPAHSPADGGSGCGNPGAAAPTRVQRNVRRALELPR